MQGKKRDLLFLLIAVAVGIVGGLSNFTFLHKTAEALSQVFINLLKLVSLPIIFLSILSTISGMEGVSEVKSLGTRVVKYTLITTILAATVALTLFLTIQPAQGALQGASSAAEVPSGHYIDYFLQIVPSNIVLPFVESNVIAVLFLAILFGLAILGLPQEKRSVLHSVFSSLYAALTSVTSWIVKLIPIAVAAFIVLFLLEMKQGLELHNLFLYLLCVVSANLIQALVVIPILLKIKGVNPIFLFKAMFPALSMAFFTKSSSATLPLAMRCSEERAHLSKRVTSFTFPLCTTINMNGCAAFILTTVLFVAMSNGIQFSGAEFVLWIFLATIAAVGNAGVPMGCYFLSSAFLAAMNVPLHILGLILPFYSLIDMLETAINVWSDSSVAAIVDKESKEKTVLA